ncbi:hypothetical protein [Phenylobacterium sp.]|uniref:hypothetical protein n=1 Tax=Phenylobacterium sp. TaxID=1871053 RepID=UPI001208B12F|nr:hypothetical protein [Phenylobacterium sp.]THD63139.1 MAG: hypothetical protein E8A12_09010 [Phenylobacterium sp.]
MGARLTLRGLVFALAIMAAPAALAAPSCLDRQGDTVRCGTRGAMPVGWTPGPDQARAHLAATDSGLDARQIVSLVCVIGGIFALFALLPDFDGAWDRQEDDCEPRG